MAAQGLRWMRAVVLIAAVVLVPWPSCKELSHEHQAASGLLRAAAGQGLSVSQEAIGAGEAATATQLDIFEDSLAISTTGGRGRGGRGGSGNLGAAAFTDVDRLQQLQRGIQYIAGSPSSFPSCQFNNSKKAGDNKRKPFCNNFIPPPRDQQSCSTCVSQSVSTAMQMAVAAALEDDVTKWEVNAASLYYCTEGGRSCSTGYDIQENLYDVIDRMPELIRPSSCLADVPELQLNKTVDQPSVLSWGPACTKAKQLAAVCNSTNTRPWLNCTYKSLSTFWEIQRHIRNHGSVITRITIYDDFDIQFGPKVRYIEGEKLPPYKFNKTAKYLYGHAAVIVGYDNDNYTWTLLNSWGSGNSSSNSRTKGITADGLFKIQMGVAGVGVPDKTYGITCVPQPGSQWDLDGVKQFYNHKPRMPVSYVDPQRDKNKKNVTCYNYNFTRTDTVASVVDAFDIDMQKFVADQMSLPVSKRAPEWGYQNITYKLSGTPTTEELSKVLSSTTIVLNNTGTFLPFIRCFHYDSAGKMSSTWCDISTGAAECNKLGNGTVDCTVYYSAFTVPLQLSKYRTVRVCNMTYPALASSNYSQPRALATLLNTKPGGARTQCGQTNVPIIGCDRQGYVTYIWPSEYIANTVKVDSWDLQPATKITGFEPRVVDALLTLKRLQAISLDVKQGTLPLQLAGLTQMQHLLIIHECLSGTLPTEWRWSGLKVLLVGSIDEETAYRQLKPGCGITGTLPVQWPQQIPNYTALDLRNNKLSGSLPVEYANSSNSIPAYVYLDSNQLTGSIPAEYANWRLAELQLQENQLTGSLPSFDGPDSTASPLQASLQGLNVSHNQLTGELPSSWRRMSQMSYLDLSYNKLQGPVPLTWADFKLLGYLELSGNTRLYGCVPVLQNPLQGFQVQPKYEKTGITGVCNNLQRNEVEEPQRKALDLLPQLYNANKPGWLDTVTTQLKSYATMQDLYGDPVEALTTVQFPDKTPDLQPHFNVTLEGIDGAIYVTQLVSDLVAVNLTVLARLLPQLPRLREFKHASVVGKIEVSASRLPANLYKVAPASLKIFHIEGNNLTGSLPVAWSGWSTIEEITIGDSKLLTGRLPEWTGMSSLRVLDLSDNNLSGPLPPAYGTASWSKQLELLNLRFNRRLKGSIPGTWASLSAYIYLEGAKITGCIPDQLNNRLSLTPGEYPPLCSAPEASNADLAALVSLQAVLRKTGMDFSTWVIEQSSGGSNSGAPPGPAPYYCRKWQGVACDAANQVSSLDLASLLQPGVTPTPTDFSDAFVAILANITGLQELKLSGCNMRGSFPQSLSSLSSLKLLDLSNNPALTGSLPKTWASLIKLETLDVSGCTVTGTIPTAYAALQWLRVFNAAGNPGITGQLPSSFGLLADLQVLDLTNASLTGQLPAAWFDSSARKAAAAALAADLAAPPSTNPPDSSTTTTTTGAVAAADAATAPAAANSSTSPKAVLGLSNLQVLRLAGNQLSGSIPDAIELLTQLRVLDLAGNKLQGTVPAKLAVLPELQEVNLANNQLQGPLLQAIARLKQLQILDLSHNSFTGTLPEVWVSLAMLKRMNLASNLLTGEFPALWGSMANPATHQLTLIDLRDNPCMDAAQLSASIAESGIEQNGRVKVLRGALDGSGRTCPTSKRR